MRVHITDKLRSGDLRNRITLQKEITVQDSKGAPYKNWEDMLTTWAKIDSMVGEEFWSAEQDNPRADGMISIRYRRDIAQTREPMRATYEGRTYRIMVAVDPDGRRHRLNMPFMETDMRDNLAAGGP